MTVLQKIAHAVGGSASFNKGSINGTDDYAGAAGAEHASKRRNQKFILAKTNKQTNKQAKKLHTHLHTKIIQYI